jgi:hypothetical protein
MIPYAIIYLLAKRAAGSSQQPAKEGSSRRTGPLRLHQHIMQDVLRLTRERSGPAPPPRKPGRYLSCLAVPFGRRNRRLSTRIGRKRAGEAAAAGFTGTGRARPARFLCPAKKACGYFLESKMESRLDAYFTQNSPN